MKIFLSHRSRDKPLVNDFKELLPSFLNPWLDDESLMWGISLETELRSTIQSGVDFLVIFLDKDALRSTWVRQELAWVIQRERELKRIFVLPVLLPEAVAEDLPPELSQRVFLQLADYGRASIESLARKATEKLFQLVVESYSSCNWRFHIPSLSTQCEMNLAQGRQNYSAMLWSNVRMGLR